MTMTTKVVTTLINPSTINNDKGKEKKDNNETNTQSKEEIDNKQILSYHNWTGDHLVKNHFVANHFVANHFFDEVNLPMAFEKITSSKVSTVSLPILT
jgi:hypothetical protein